MKSPLYPIGVQSFRKLRETGCIYVDKTADIYNLITGGTYYFLSRPRRFGKSLLVSTLEEFFRGNRELFKGLAIDSLVPETWEEHAVLHFDMSPQTYTTLQALDDHLDKNLRTYEAIYGHDEHDKSMPHRFESLIDHAYEATGRRVVVLIDEYDVPIIRCMNNQEFLDHNKALLHDFYGVMKAKDAKLRFVLLTGVGKLGKLSVFSGLNNILDISILPKYSSICGITEDELHRYFEDGVRELAASHGWSTERTYDELKQMYDGYHFAEDLKDIYNPFSILNCLATQKLGSYWFQSGTPTHLLHVLKTSEDDLSKLNGTTISAETLDSADVIQYQPTPFMFYTGYLTIKSYDERRRRYTLRYPNAEVEQGFIGSLLPLISSKNVVTTDNFVYNCCDMIDENRIDDFMKAMKAFYAGIPYDLESRNEYFYQNVMYCVAKLLGYYVQAEYHTSAGRIDLVLGNRDTVYVIEFKLDGSAEEALAQIEDKGYTMPFAIDSRRVVKVGANFDPATRTLEKWIVADNE